MTLVAFNTHRTHADLITDTLSYTRCASELGAVDKAVPLPHLDAVITFRGVGLFRAVWPAAVASLAAGSFDELLDRTPDALRALWQQAQHEPAADSGAFVYQIGYSLERGRFVAYAYGTPDNFTPEDVTGRLVVLPTPIRAVRAPASAQQWAGLAKRVRSDYAAAPMGVKVPIGGDVLLTHLEVGALSQRRIHAFPDDDPETAQMLSGTLHPTGQLGDCDCGSGQMLVLCCIEPDDSDCACDSGARFVDCCKVSPQQILDARAARRAVAGAA